MPPIRISSASRARLSLVRVVLGVAASLALTRLITSLLVEVKPHDRLTFGLISLLMIAVALVSCYMPARRAAKVDPMIALRYE